MELMSVDHGRLEVLVAEEFLHGPDVGAQFQQMGGERTEGVTGGMLGEPRRGGCRFDDPLEE